MKIACHFINYGIQLPIWLIIVDVNFDHQMRWYLSNFSSVSYPLFPIPLSSLAESLWTADSCEQVSEDGISTKLLWILVHWFYICPALHPCTYSIIYYTHMDCKTTTMAATSGHKTDGWLCWWMKAFFRVDNRSCNNKLCPHKNLYMNVLQAFFIIAKMK